MQTPKRSGKTTRAKSKSTESSTADVGVSEQKRSSITSGHRGTAVKVRTWTHSGTDCATLSEWGKLLSGRLYSLAAADHLLHLRNKQRRILSCLGTIGREWSPDHYEIAHVPTDSEHSDILKKAWEDLIRMGEPASWGVCYRSDTGHIILDANNPLKVHDSIPTPPEMAPGSELVVVIRNPHRPGKLCVEPTSQLSSEKRLDERFGRQLPPEWSHRVMDEPFRELERISADLVRHLDSGTPITAEQKTIADEVESLFLGAMGQAASLLTLTDRDPAMTVRLIQAPDEGFSLAVSKLDAVRQVSDWLAFASLVIAAVTAFQNFKEALSETEMKEARTRLKFQDRTGTGRGKDPDREKIVSEIVEMLKREPAATCDECVADLLKRKLLRENSTGGFLRVNRVNSKVIKRGSFNKWFSDACRRAGIIKRRKGTGGAADYLGHP